MVIAGQYNFGAQRGARVSRISKETRKAKKSKFREEKSEDKRMTSRKGTEVCTIKILDDGKLLSGKAKTNGRQKQNARMKVTA